MYSDCSDHTLTYSSVQYKYCTAVIQRAAGAATLGPTGGAVQCSATGHLRCIGPVGPLGRCPPGADTYILYTDQLTHSNSRYNLTTCEFNVSVYHQDQEENQRNMNASIPNLKEYPPRNGKTVSLSLLLYTCLTRLELINYLPLKSTYSTLTDWYRRQDSPDGSRPAGSDATVAALLTRGARPDRTDDHGNTALLAAIQSGVSSTIALLAPVTNTGLENALQLLARDQVSMSPPATRELVERAARDPETALE